MPSSIARKRWLPLILISGITAVSLLQGWAVSRSPVPESDYRQSLQLLFDTTNSTLRSLEYKPSSHQMTSLLSIRLLASLAI